MGCCVSSGKADRNKENVTDKNTTNVEEETVVKEVLSETTFLTTSSNVHDLTTFEDPVKTKIRETEGKKLKIAPDSGMTRPDLIDPEEGSEVSEICSLSLSESVSSTAVMMNEEEPKQRKSQRSPAKTRTRVTGNNYPTRKTTDQSPRRRNNGSTCNGGARFVSGTRDPGERSGRRSRSPAMNRSVMDPNQSIRVDGVRTRKNNPSPGRVRIDPNKNRSDQQQCQNYGYTTEELLENPLVSLECFIFL
ncbi:unnamed protein product [Microthlaspi erraticum]|uniref:Uncharacterized protein n=1 Tax=Microthlaspi erraticum TaxID=1685480 RepID=A0A6D2IX35_9BRAS|nr:unnamed protein product [Microthlaspi erraticum]